MISDALSSGQLAYQVMIPGGISPSGHQWVPPVIYYDPHLYSSFDDMMANAYNNSQQSQNGAAVVGGTGTGP